MLRLSLAFLLVAILAGIFGFGMVEGFAFDAAKILFFVFLVLAALMFVVNGFRSTPPV